jgi:hypothetical protein
MGEQIIELYRLIYYDSVFVADKIRLKNQKTTSIIRKAKKNEASISINF